MTRQGHLNRRTVLAGSAAAAVALLAPSFPRAALARTSVGGESATLRLPAPTGPYPVGTVARHLVDAVRPDPIAPTPRARELMVTLWYPARQSARPHAPYLSGTLSALLVRQVNALIGASYPDDLLTSPPTPAGVRRRHPVSIRSCSSRRD